MSAALAEMHPVRKAGGRLPELRRRVRIVAWVLAGLAAAQLIQPETPKMAGTERAMWDRPETNARVAAVLKRSCGDCHSNETNWPWYTNISPGSWLMAKHVAQGRSKLNFNAQVSLNATERGKIADLASKGDMPPTSYLWLHPGARLHAGDLAILKDWAAGKLDSK